MASVEITISGVLYDKLARTSRPVVLIGEASLTGLGVGGGPIYPPDSGGGEPPGIWGPPGPWPTPPIYLPPEFGGRPPGGPSYRPEHPIVLPPEQVPPDLKPPTPPNPGDPTQPVPPPAGSAGWPVNPVVPPPYVIINYPGIGPIVVPPPKAGAPTPAVPKR